MLMYQWKQQKVAQVLGPLYTHVEDSGEGPASQLQPDPALAATAVWAVNQLIKDSLSDSPLLFL